MILPCDTQISHYVTCTRIATSIANVMLLKSVFIYLYLKMLTTVYPACLSLVCLKK